MVSPMTMKLVRLGSLIHLILLAYSSCSSINFSWFFSLVLLVPQVLLQQVPGSGSFAVI